MNEIIIRPAETGEASYVSYFNMMLYRDQHDDKTAQLRWFAVEKDYRGHGVGSKLMRAAKEFCLKHGYSKVYLGTIDFLTDARRLYAKFGFELTSTWINHDWGQHPISEERWDLKEWK